MIDKQLDPWQIRAIRQAKREYKAERKWTDALAEILVGVVFMCLLAGLIYLGSVLAEGR